MDISQPTIGVAIDPKPAQEGGEAVGKAFDKIDARARRAAENSARYLRAISGSLQTLRRLLPGIAAFFSVRGVLNWANAVVDGLEKSAERAKKLGLALTENEKAAIEFKKQTDLISAGWKDFGENVLGGVWRMLKRIADAAANAKTTAERVPFNISGGGNAGAGGWVARPGGAPGERVPGPAPGRSAVSAQTREDQLDLAEAVQKHAEEWEKLGDAYANAQVEIRNGVEVFELQNQALGEASAIWTRYGFAVEEAGDALETIAGKRAGGGGGAGAGEMESMFFPSGMGTPGVSGDIAAAEAALELVQGRIEIGTLVLGQQIDEAKRLADNQAALVRQASIDYNPAGMLGGSQGGQAGPGDLLPEIGAELTSAVEGLVSMKALIGGMIGALIAFVVTSETFKQFTEKLQIILRFLQTVLEPLKPVLNQIALLLLGVAKLGVLFLKPFMEMWMRYILPQLQILTKVLGWILNVFGLKLDESDLELLEGLQEGSTVELRLDASEALRELERARDTLLTSGDDVTREAARQQFLSARTAAEAAQRAATAEAAPEDVFGAEVDAAWLKILERIADAVEWIKTAWDKAWRWFASAWDRAWSWFADVWDKAWSWFEKAMERVIELLDKGKPQDPRDWTWKDNPVTNNVPGILRENGGSGSGAPVILIMDGGGAVRQAGAGDLSAWANSQLIEGLRYLTRTGAISGLAV